MWSKAACLMCQVQCMHVCGPQQRSGVSLCFRGTNRLEGFFHQLRELVTSSPAGVELMDAYVSEFIFRCDRSHHYDTPIHSCRWNIDACSRNGLSEQYCALRMVELAEMRKACADAFSEPLFPGLLSPLEFAETGEKFGQVAPLQDCPDSDSDCNEDQVASPRVQASLTCCSLSL